MRYGQAPQRWTIMMTEENECKVLRRLPVTKDSDPTTGAGGGGRAGVGVRRAGDGEGGAGLFRVT